METTTLELMMMTITITTRMKQNKISTEKGRAVSGFFVINLTVGKVARSESNGAENSYEFSGVRYDVSESLHKNNHDFAEPRRNNYDFAISRQNNFERERARSENL